MNVFGSVCHYFVRNRKLSLLLFCAVILWGILSFIVTPKEYNPEIVAPAFDVTVEFPGSSAREVYELVTRPLEDVIQQIPGVDEIYSQSHHGGRSIVTVLFDVGEDFDLAKIRLRQRITSNLDLKPLGVTDVLVESIDPDDLAIMTIGLFSDALDPTTLRKRALLIKDLIKQIPGTSIVDVVGGRQREFKILLNPDKLEETKTSIDEVEKALNKSSLLSVLGSIKGRNQFQSVEASGTVKNIEDIRNLVVISNVAQSLTIGDIGEVVEGTVEDDTYTNYYDKHASVDHAVMITVAKKKGENISKITRAVRHKLSELEDRSALLTGIGVKILRDEGRVASEEITGLTFNLMQAIIIVFIVLFAFLNARAAVMVAITIPLTLLTVFGIGNLFGYTINRITLFALILSLGLLVDSATVVVENIVRNKRTHPNWSKIKVINISVSQVGVGLFLSTLTTVLAFIPMRFVTGMMGPYMGPLPFFVSAAITVSLVYSYTIVPWMASFFCKDGAVTDKATRIRKLYESFIAWYTRLIGTILDSRRNRRLLMSLSALLIVIVLAFPIAKLLRFRMLPKADREQMYVYLDLDQGTSIERTYEISKELSQKLAELPQVTSVQSFVGTPQIMDFNGMFKGSAYRRGTHQATLKINLTHPDQRDRMSEELAVAYRRAMKAWLETYPDATIQIIEDPPGPPVRATFFVKIKGDDRTVVEQVVRDLETKAQDIDELHDIDTSLPEYLTKYTLRVDTKKAAQAKASTAAIAHALEVLYRGSVIGVYHDNTNREQETIVLRFPKKYRNSIEGLNDIMIINEQGNPIPVQDFLHIDEKRNSDVIQADNREEVAYISGEMGERSVTYASIDFLQELHGYRPPFQGATLASFSPLTARYEMPDGRWVTVEMNGEWKMTLEVFRDLGLAMAVAIMLIYIVLVAQFRSYMIPLLISATIPLALVGVFPGFAFLFWTGRIYFSATSMIGVIALAGIVVNNAIILLEYIMSRLRSGEGLRESIIHACAVRLRPIVLTSLTTILGSLAIAGDPVWSGLAWSIAFGLSLSAVLTLIVFPTLVYHFFEHRHLLPQPDAC